MASGAVQTGRLVFLAWFCHGGTGGYSTAFPPVNPTGGRTLYRYSPIPPAGRRRWLARLIARCFQAWPVGAGHDAGGPEDGPGAGEPQQGFAEELLFAEQVVGAEAVGRDGIDIAEAGEHCPCFQQKQSLQQRMPHS